MTVLTKRTCEVMGRNPCCDKSRVKRGSWSPEEDATLKSYLLEHGTGGNWISLPQKAGTYNVTVIHSVFLFVELLCDS